jgi:DNA ligase-1
MHHILQSIRATSSKNEKEAIIRQHADNELFRLLLTLTYSPLVKFGVKVLPEPIETTDKMLDLESALNLLHPLINRHLTGHAALNHVAYILAHTTPEDRDIIEKVIDRSLKLGCNVSTINKAIGKNFIKESPYMGAVSYDKTKVAKLFEKYSTVFSQLKMDGRYTNIAIDNGVSMESRQGLPTYFANAFDFLLGLDEVYGQPLVLHGEMVIHGMDRYTANGIIAAMVSIGDKIQEGTDVAKDLSKFAKEQGVSYEQMLSQVSVVVWDFIPLSVYTHESKWNNPYLSRLDELQRMVNHIDNSRLSLVESRQVSNATEAMEHFLACRARGEEGTILKGNAPWQDGKPVFCVKFKTELELELEVEPSVGSYGQSGTKNQCVISSLNVQSADGLLKTSPAGMSETLMSWVTENKETLAGTIVTVKCNGISKDREGNYSCLHPAVVAFRTDKTVANTLAECLEIDASSKEIG